MRVFITGLSSFLGRHLLANLNRRYTVVGTFWSNPVQDSRVQAICLDIREESALDKAFDRFKPHVVVHIASITGVSACENDPELAQACNGQGTTYVAKLCQQKGVRLIHISTDMVFDGEKETAYNEEDVPAPITVYGQTKLQGEQLVLGECPQAVILRPTLMYGDPVGAKKGFLAWMQQEASQKGKVSLFKNQVRTPVFVRDVCRVIWQMIEETCTGIFHVGGPDHVNRVEMGKMFLPLVGISANVIAPMRIEDLKLPYKVQRNLCLDSNKIQKRLGFEFTPLMKGLRLSVHSRTTV